MLKASALMRNPSAIATSSEVRTINTCSLHRTVSPLFHPSFAPLRFISLSLVGRGYPQNLAGLSFTRAPLRVREDRDSLLKSF